MTDSFDGKTALITGGASGIGLATAHELAARGVQRIILNDQNADALSAVELPDCEIVALPGDVTQEEFRSAAADTLAGIDLAVVNAGISTADMITDIDFADWRRTMAVNLDGAFLTLRAVMRAMTAHERGGAIVCTASTGGIKPEIMTAAYGTSKAGLTHLSRVAAKEMAPHGIRVNAIAPGGVETPIWDAMPFFENMVAQTGSREAAFAAMAKMATPLGRYATAEEIAKQIAFLLSDDAATITGATITSDGGYSI